MTATYHAFETSESAASAALFNEETKSNPMSGWQGSQAMQIGSVTSWLSRQRSQKEHEMSTERVE